MYSQHEFHRLRPCNEDLSFKSKNVTNLFIFTFLRTHSVNIIVSAGTCSFTNGVFWSLATENAKICHGFRSDASWAMNAFMNAMIITTQYTVWQNNKHKCLLNLKYTYYGNVLCR